MNLNGATAEGDNGALRGRNATLWEGGHRVPAIAAWPGRIAPGTSDALALTMDLMPTLLELAGVSLAGVLLRGEALAPRQVFWSYGGRFAVREGEWKLLVGEGGAETAKHSHDSTRSGGERLFNLADDPVEARDLAPAEPARRDALFAALARWRETLPR